MEGQTMNTFAVNAFLADAAESVQGKIYAIGVGWNNLFSQAFPLMHPRMALGAMISVPYTATNAIHKFRVHLEDADAKKISLKPGGEIGEPAPTMLEFGTDFNVGRPPLLPAGDAQIVPVSLVFDQLVLEVPGMYNWVISIDDNEITRLQMRATLFNQPSHVETSG
ncbi:MAG: hypothetical protein WDO06_03225 [Actinomycetota bacterium]